MGGVHLCHRTIGEHGKIRDQANHIHAWTWLRVQKSPPLFHVVAAKVQTNGLVGSGCDLIRWCHCARIVDAICKSKADNFVVDFIWWHEMRERSGADDLYILMVRRVECGHEESLNRLIAKGISRNEHRWTK